MRKVFSLLLTLLLCFSFSTTASAATIPDGTIQPYYEKAYKATSELSISGTTATCTSRVQGDSDVIKIVAVQTLEKQGFLWIWSTYNNTVWIKTVYINAILMSNTKSGLASGKYRLKTEFTLTSSDGTSETITVYSDDKKVS